MDLNKVQSCWHGVIAREYRDGRIINERTLQALLYGQLREAYPELETYIEPGLKYREGGGPRFRPDIVVCSSTAVLMFAEIKFLPHWYPDVSKDLRTLASLDVERGEEHELRIDPQTGQFMEHAHAVTDATRFALFIVGRGEAEAVDADWVRRHEDARQIADRLAIFYGRISPGADPDFGSNMPQLTGVPTCGGS